MPTITRKQYESKKAMTPEGWEYDVQTAVIWGRHELTRRVYLDEFHFVAATICYKDEPVPGNRWATTGRQIPVIHVQYWTLNPKKNLSTSSGLGSDYMPIGEPEPRKNYKSLCKYAAEITEERIMDIYTANRKKCLDPVLI